MARTAAEALLRGGAFCQLASGRSLHRFELGGDVVPNVTPRQSPMHRLKLEKQPDVYLPKNFTIKEVT